jgi:hypothetical protein
LCVFAITKRYPAMTFSNCAVVCGELDIPFDQVHRGSTGPLQTSVDERKRDKLDETYRIQPYADPSLLAKRGKEKNESAGAGADDEVEINMQSCTEFPRQPKKTPASEKAKKSGLLPGC